MTRPRDPHLQYVTQTAVAIARTLRAGQLICLESTTYPDNTHFNVATIIPKVLGGVSSTRIDPFCLP